MFALFLTNLLSPRGIMISIIVLVIGFCGLEAYRFVDKYDAAMKENITLQANVKTLQSAITQQKNQMITQQQIYTNTLASIQIYDAMVSQQLTNTKNDYSALESIKVPVNAAHECYKSPYISTILERLRARNTTNYSGNAGNNAAGTK